MLRKTLLALAVALPCLAGSAFAGDFSAIAYSPSTGNSGYSYSCDTLGQAEALALANCSAPDATIEVWSQNQYCALAVADNGAIGWGVADSQADAEAIALAEDTGPNASIVAWAGSYEYYYYYWYDYS